jgi:photosystem II stability/assembly factor-like uncharacterized protein
MRTLSFLAVLFTAIFLFTYIPRNTELNIKVSSENKNFEKENSETDDEEGREGSHEYERKYFSEWNYPYVNGIPPVVQERIVNDLKSMPGEPTRDNDAVNSWVLLGPAGISYQGNPSIKYSGRVKDVEPPTSSHGLRIGAATGGIWSYSFIFPVCISNGIQTAWLGSFASDPTNPNLVLAGTGEPDARTCGLGLWKTTNGGAIWFKDNFAGVTPCEFYKIRFDRNNPVRVHAACDSGYFRSDNSGATWVRRYMGCITDVETVYGNPNIIYIAEKNPTGPSGILKSTNGGNNFSRITFLGNGLPDVNLDRSVICTGNSPNIVYTMLGDGATQAPKGVYKSTNSGANWTNITPQNVQGQGFWDPRVEYKSVITVCPSDPNIVMVGVTAMFRSTNGGQSWVRHAENELHGDHHRMEWKDNNTVYSANDGGVAVSTDKGITWSTTINILPITQFYHFDVGVSNKRVISGGTQDNGTVLTQNLGNSWTRIDGGDGGGNEIDPANSNDIFITVNAAGNIAFRRFRTTNSGLSWSDITSNLPPHNDWVPAIESDKTPPIWLYTNGGPHMFKSTNFGANWITMNSTAFPTPYVLNFAVTRYVSGTGSIVYACLKDGLEGGNHSGKLLRVYDNGTWYERSAGLPQSGTWVRNVAVHPTNINIAYALMNGFSGQKVFKTTNRGITWTNITGNLPNVPVSDLVPHPTDNNKLYLSSEYGCFKTTNGGVNWFRWNNGMPGILPEYVLTGWNAVIVNDLKTIDSTLQNGKYYVLAATHGRGIWMREISGDDPIGIINNSTPVAFKLSQNYPNPFNPSTKIDYSIAKGSIVKIVVYDILGRVVKTLVNEKETPGSYTIEFNAANLSSGIYFYRLETEAFRDVKKMILVK